MTRVRVLSAADAAALILRYQVDGLHAVAPSESPAATV